MKKRLEADLISIAHRILQLKNKSDINQLYLETQKLYEKLSVLRFVEENFGDVKPTIGRFEIEKEVEIAFDKEETEQPIAIQANKEKEADETIKTPSFAIEENTPELVEETSEEKTVASNDSVFKMAFELEDETEQTVKETPEKLAFELENEVEEAEELLEETSSKLETVQISFKDLLGGNYEETLFVKKVQQVENVPATITIDIPKDIEFQKKQTGNVTNKNIKNKEAKTVSLNDKLSKGLNIDLNDRIAFIKHLFGNSNEDYNRVLNQLITFDSFSETQDFIEEMVKPDYNNWEGKDDYAQRFMEIVEKKFV